jgi:hypothetical protein
VSPLSSPPNQGRERFTRNGIDKYVPDCVIFLDHRVEDQTSIRRLRVIKYRGKPVKSTAFIEALTKVGKF